MQGTILKGIGGFYYALDDEGTVQTLRAQGKLRRERLKPKAGDRVEMSPGDGEEHGWILKILPRRNSLVRPPVANIDVLLLVVAAVTPNPDLMLVDKLLVNARRAEIPVKLVINKSDLAPEIAQDIARQYAAADVDPICVSAAEGMNIDALRDSVKGKIHAFVGQSGAGKSSLINALHGLTMETGSLSRKIERGKNTTRTSELVVVENGGMVLDTPGFSLLDTEEFEPIELKDSYPEFMNAEGCYFQPCYHASEPRCVVRDAVAEGRISRERHERYVELLEELKQKWRERYD